MTLFPKKEKWIKIKHTYNQGCASSFPKELSSGLKFLGHLELQFRSSSSQPMHELSYSSVQFHPSGTSWSLAFHIVFLLKDIWQQF